MSSIISQIFAIPLAIFNSPVYQIRQTKHLGFLYDKIYCPKDDSKRSHYYAYFSLKLLLLFYVIFTLTRISYVGYLLSIGGKDIVAYSQIDPVIGNAALRFRIFNLYTIPAFIMVGVYFGYVDYTMCVKVDTLLAETCHDVIIKNSVKFFSLNPELKFPEVRRFLF